MVVKRHHSTLLDEEKNETVVIIIRLVNRDTVQVLAPMVLTVLPLNSKLLWCDSTHF